MLVGAFPARDLAVLRIGAPKDTPAEIVQRLNREIAKAMALPDVKEKCAQLGFEPVANTPDQFAAYIKKEVEKWGKVIKDAKIPQIQ